MIVLAVAYIIADSRGFDNHACGHELLTRSFYLSSRLLKIGVHDEFLLVV